MVKHVVGVACMPGWFEACIMLHCVVPLRHFVSAKRVTQRCTQHNAKMDLFLCCVKISCSLHTVIVLHRTKYWAIGRAAMANMNCSPPQTSTSEPLYNI